MLIDIRIGAMRYNILVLVLLPYILTNADTNGTQESPNNATFVPTKQWQVVKKGTPIPRGLHVRHNFQTGLTEAKLMDPDEEATEQKYDALRINNDDSPKSIALLPESEEQSKKTKREFESLNHIPMSPKELSRKLKKIKKSKASLTSNTDEEKATADKEPKQQDYDGVDIDLGGTIDADLLAIFVDKFNEHKNAIISGNLNNDEAKIIGILSQLEDLVHDIDNGLEFTRVGGLAKVISPCMNGTNDDIKYEALRVLGAAAQSNPQVKEAALELDFVPTILRTLIKCTDSKLKDRCIHALGSLVRHYPAAQKVFLNHGGMEIFVTILSERHKAPQKRIMHLINDLILERTEVGVSETSELKTQEYAEVNWEEKLISHKFCKQLGDILVTTISHQSEAEFSMEDHELLESIYECVLTTTDICKLDLQSGESRILPALNEIEAMYHRLEANGNSNNNELFEHLVMLTQQVRRTIFIRSREEL